MLEWCDGAIFPDPGTLLPLLSTFRISWLDGYNQMRQPRVYCGDALGEGFVHASHYP